MIDVIAFYKFVRIANIKDVQQKMLIFSKKRKVYGTILIAQEGVNGTISGNLQDLTDSLSYLAQLIGVVEIEFKASHADDMPFHRLRIRLKKEIVTIGDSSVDPSSSVGKYVEPKNWDALIERDDILLIDTRNDYEVDIGTFKGAVNPNTASFREFPDYVKSIDPNKNPKIAMFCTGGIRCEKASSYMLSQGFKEVYHLKGGILKYLEEIPQEEGSWQGDCFVFDSRVSVGYGLELGQYDQCFGCRHPISEQEKESPLYVKGVCCPKCHDKRTERQKQSAAQRQLQVELAHQRQTTHFGPESQKNVSHQQAQPPLQSEV